MRPKVILPSLPNAPAHYLARIIESVAAVRTMGGFQMSRGSFNRRD